MENRDMTQRIEWATQLLDRLDRLNREQAQLEADADDACGAAMSEARAEGNAKIQAKRQLHQQRTEELKACLTTITSITNEWHAFTQNPENQHRWSYPFRLARLGKETNARLKAEQERIQGLVLQNRLLEQEIRRLGDTVQRDALLRMKEGSSHAALLTSLEKRQSILDDLVLLLPTIPATATCQLDPAHPELVLSMLAV